MLESRSATMTETRPAAWIAGWNRQFAQKLLAFNILAGVFGWSYATTFAQMAERWTNTPEYSHGWLIPLFSLWLIGRHRASRREGWLSPTNLAGSLCIGLGLYLGTQLPRQPGWNPAIPSVMTCCGAATLLAGWLHVPERGAWLWGGLVLLAGAVFRLGTTFYFYEWFDELSVIPVLLGLALIVFGVALPRGMLSGTCFLVFMVPLPYRLENFLRAPLRGVATNASTFVLQTLGFPALAEGFVISIGETRLGVAEACSGLSMLMVFGALTAGVVLLVKRPWWYRALLCLSWPAIAIVANVFRIVVTAALYSWGYEKFADVTYHDLAGLAMMPVGIVLLWAEMAYLDRLFVLEVERRVSPFVLELPSAPREVAMH
jgi:exosortase